MADLVTIKKCLFKDVNELPVPLTELELDLKRRLEVCIGKLMDSPMMTDKELVAVMTDKHNTLFRPIGQSQAYRTLGVIRQIVGNISEASKQWQRYTLVEKTKDILQKAEADEDWKACASLLDKIGKYQRLDKDDETADWKSMIPPDFFVTDDYATIEGLEVKPKEYIENRKRELRKIFGMESAVDAEYTEVADADID